MIISTTPHRVAVVTGGAKGIGLAIGQWFLAQGYRVALLDMDAATLKTAVEKLQALHGQDAAVGAHCDVSDPAGVHSAIARVDTTFGRIDALVNNAGMAVFKPIGETTFDEWRSVLGVNLDGTFLCSQACIPIMRRTSLQDGGAIVNIASISGLRASTLRVAYGTSKAAIIQLTKQQAVELGRVGIRANVVAPGPVETDMAKRVHSAAIRAAYHDAIPLNRYGTVEEIAACVGFLCSPAAGYVNGQVLAVDGGFEATGVGLPALRENQPGNNTGPH